MNIDFRGYGENVATFMCSSEVKAGSFVVMDSNYRVRLAQSGDAIFGYCVGVRDGYAAIQLSGYVEARKRGNIRVGYRKLACLDFDSIFEYSIGLPHKVIYVDDDTIGFLL